MTRANQYIIENISIDGHEEQMQLFLSEILLANEKDQRFDSDLLILE